MKSLMASWCSVGSFLFLFSSAMAQESNPGDRLSEVESRSVFNAMFELGVGCGGSRISASMITTYDETHPEGRVRLHVGFDRLVGGCSIKIESPTLYEHEGESFLVLKYLVQQGFGSRSNSESVQKEVIVKSEEQPWSREIARVLRRYGKKTQEVPFAGRETQIQVFRSHAIVCSYAVVPNSKPSCVVL